MNATLCRLVLILLFTLSVSVQADDAAPPLIASGAWIRTPPPGSPVMAGYVTLRNDGKREVRFAKVESASFGAIEIHEMRELNGLMRMRPVPSIVVQPGDTVALEPGGLHLMLFRPSVELVAGAKVELNLILDAGAGAQSIEFEVRDEAP